MPKNLKHLRRIDISRTPTNLGTVLDEVLPKDAVVPSEVYEDLAGHLYGAALMTESVILWRVDVEKYNVWHLSNIKTILLPPNEFPGRTLEDAIDEAWQDGAWD
jgi:hypothetical protein